MRDAFFVSAPASSANLGPALDALAVALELRMSAHVQPSRRFTIGFDGSVERPTHDGLERAIVRAMHAVNVELPPVRIDVENAIPLGKGLGSSAAAAILGIAIALRSERRAMHGRTIARIASALEGHPENALAALHGGAVIAGSSDASRVLRLQCSPHVRPVVVVPDFDLSTHAARALLPERYDRADVISTAQRAAFLGAALAAGTWRGLQDAMRDCIHQPYRAAHIPGMAEALRVRATGLAGIAISGAGPGVIALVHAHVPWERIAQSILPCFGNAGCDAYAMQLEFAHRGLLLRTQAQERRKCA